MLNAEKISAGSISRMYADFRPSLNVQPHNPLLMLLPFYEGTNLRAQIRKQQSKNTKYEDILYVREMQS